MSNYSLTTAEYRKLAYGAAERLHYARAAALMTAAIEAYPAGTGQLRAADLVRMREQLNEWRKAIDSVASGGY